MKNSEKEKNLCINGDLGSIIISPIVIEEITKDILKEIPGIEGIRLNFLTKKTNSGKVSVSTNESTKGISLTVAVCLVGQVPVKTVAVQIQERLIHEIPKMVGIRVDEVIVVIEKINI